MVDVVVEACTVNVTVIVNTIKVVVAVGLKMHDVVEETARFTFAIWVAMSTVVVAGTT